VKPRIALASSAVNIVEWFLIDQISRATHEYDVDVYVQTADTELLRRRGIDARVIPTAIERKIRPLRDLAALWQLWRAFRREGYVLVHSTGPKGGLLSMTAAWLARVPVRLHTFTGQVWAGSSGLARWVLKTADRVTAMFATHILIDSPSQRRFLIDERVVSARRSSVLLDGSISGVDVQRFSPQPARRRSQRAEWNIGEGAFVVLFLARLTRDKGALVMAEGFARFWRECGGDPHLLVVGPDEEDLAPVIREICHDCLDRVHVHGRTRVPEHFMAAADVLCLPSFREGFGTVLINAAACGIPAVASRIYGSEDAVVDGETGLLIPAGDAQALADVLRRLAKDPDLRARMGSRGRARAEDRFAEPVVSEALLAFYRAELREKTAPNHYHSHAK
jgi:glycosyltransferase involved in cell wall biosynthesis